MGSKRTGEENKKKGILQLGNYELGRNLGEGNFGKVKLAMNLHSGLTFAVKILDKAKLIQLSIADQVPFFSFLSISFRLKFVLANFCLWLCSLISVYCIFTNFEKSWIWKFAQIKREIATLKLLKHPNVVRLHEVCPFCLSYLNHLWCCWMPINLLFYSLINACSCWDFWLRS